MRLVLWIMLSATLVMGRNTATSVHSEFPVPRVSRPIDNSPKLIPTGSDPDVSDQPDDADERKLIGCYKEINKSFDAIKRYLAMFENLNEPSDIEKGCVNAIKKDFISKINLPASTNIKDIKLYIPTARDGKKFGKPFGDHWVVVDTKTNKVYIVSEKTGKFEEYNGGKIDFIGGNKDELVIITKEGENKYETKIYRPNGNSDAAITQKNYKIEEPLKTEFYGGAPFLPDLVTKSYKIKDDGSEIENSASYKIGNQDIQGLENILKLLKKDQDIPAVTPPAVTPPAVTPPAVTPPAVTPPAVTPPAVTPPLPPSQPFNPSGASPVPDTRPFSESQTIHSAPSSILGNRIRNRPRLLRHNSNSPRILFPRFRRR